MRSIRARKPASTLRNLPPEHHRLSTAGRPSGPRKRGALFSAVHSLWATPRSALWRNWAPGFPEREDEHEHRSLVRSAPAGVTEDLRQRALPPRSAGALGLAGAPFLLEHDDLVVQGDVALRPAEHLDRGGQLASRGARERLDPAQDLDAFVGDPALVLPPLRHARPSCRATICTARPRRHEGATGSRSTLARLVGGRTCEGRPGRIAWPPSGRRSGGEAASRSGKGVVRTRRPSRRAQLQPIEFPQFRHL